MALSGSRWDSLREEEEYLERHYPLVPRASNIDDKRVVIVGAGAAGVAAAACLKVCGHTGHVFVNHVCFLAFCKMRTIRDCVTIYRN